jgi:hypothetical protein
MPDVTASDLGASQDAGHIKVAATKMRSPFLNETVRIGWLSIFLRVLSVGFLAAFIPWITLILLNAPILAPGGFLAPWLRFQPYNAHYESMLTVLHLTWAVMLWRASDNPAKHSLFVDFTMWANAAHGVVMLILTPMQKGLVMTVIEGLPLLGIAAVLWWLRPRQPDRAPAPA